MNSVPRRIRATGRQSPLLALALAGLWPVAGSADYATVSALNEGRLYGEAYRALAAETNAPNADPRLVRLLGDAYASGRGVTADPSKAVVLYKRAALAGDTTAALRLGELYERGEGVPKSPRQAFDWYLKAADRDPEAAFKVAAGALANPDAPMPAGTGDPIARLTFAAERGHAEAQRLLGTLYFEGRKVDQDAALAAKWLEAGADGSAESDRQLGIVYAGSSNAEMRAKGLQLLQRAYEAGDAVAAAYLGLHAERAASSIDQKKAAHAYYVAATPAGIEWAEAGRKRLEANFASIEIFGLKMQGARRIELLRHLDARGVTPQASALGVYDAFSSDTLVPGSQSLTAFYAPGPEQYVAELALRFAADSPAQAEEVFERLRARLMASYGQSANGSTRALTRWRAGLAEVSLKPASAHGTVMVVYRFQPYADELARAIQAAQAPAPSTGG
jgi:TPR repeat protein